MAFAYKEAARVAYQEPDAGIQDLTVLSYLDNVTLDLVTLQVGGLEVKAEMDNVTLLLPAGGEGTGSFFLVM